MFLFPKMASHDVISSNKPPTFPTPTWVPRCVIVSHSNSIESNFRSTNFINTIVLSAYQHSCNSCSCTAYGVVQYETRSNSTLLPYMYESSWLCVSPILCSSDQSLVCASVRVCSAANPRTNSTVFWLTVRGSTSLLDAQPLLMCPICRICPTLNSLLEVGSSSSF